jgi:hypothetical protein
VSAIHKPRRVTLLALVLVLAGFGLVVALAPPALAGVSGGPVIQLSFPPQAKLGQVVEVRAVLEGPSGKPIPSVMLTFSSPAAWAGGTEYTGDMYLGTAETNASGVAVLAVRMARSGPITIVAHFDGVGSYAPAVGVGQVTVVGDAQLYTPTAGIKVPGLGPWVLALVIAALYMLYILVVSRVLAISRSPSALRKTRAPAVGSTEAPGLSRSIRRRDFIGQLAVPGLLGVAVVTLGSGLETIVRRAPHTHGNLAEYTSASRYDRTPFAQVGRGVAAQKLPQVLERPVTFEDVRPILMRRAGPHVVLPENQPPPKGIRLDDYDSIVAYSSLVVPGKPDQSGIVSVLLDPAMHMPPSLPSLPEEEIQIIVSWIAQGAKRS